MTATHVLRQRRRPGGPGRARPSPSSATAARATPTPSTSTSRGRRRRRAAPGSKSRALAAEAGLRVIDVADAVKAADVVMILVPDTAQKAVYDAEIAPNLRPGQLLMFAHGFNIHFGRIDPPGGVDVGMVAPKGPGHLLRSRLPGRRRRARAVRRPSRPDRHRPRAVLAYARAIGSTRAGVLETTFAEETETDLFGEQAVLCGGTAALVKMAFETLVEAGYQPELAYFETMHELKLIVDLMYRGGLNFMRFSVSDTAEYGDYVSGPRIIDERVRATMKAGPREIQDGASRSAGSPRTSPAAPSSSACAQRPQPPDRAGRRAAARPDGVPRPGEVEAGQAAGRAPRRPGAGPMSARPRTAARRAVASPAGSVRIFDTTLRDGEQAPGAGADRRREARGRAPARAAQGRRHRGRLPGRLAGRLRGGPAHRPGDPRRDRRRRRSRAATTATRSGRSRRSASPSGRTSTCSSPRATSTSRTSCASTRERRSPRPSAGSATAARRSAATPRSSSAPRTPRAPTSTSCSRSSRRSSTPARPTVNIPDTVGYAIPTEFGALVGGWSTLVGARRPSASTATTTSASPRPTRSRRPGGRAPGRGHHQRPRRARRQRVARRGRHGPAHAAGEFPTRATDVADRADHRRQPARQLPDRLPGPAQQGDRRRQRVRPRVRHPPGRRPQEPADLRDHDPAVGRAVRLR